MAKSAKHVQVPIPTTSNTGTNSKASGQEARQSNVDNSTGRCIMSKCQALTKKGTTCKNGIKSGATIAHGDDNHSHYLCGPHFDVYTKDPMDLVINTEKCPAPKVEPQPDLFSQPTVIGVFGDFNINHFADVLTTLKEQLAKAEVKFRRIVVHTVPSKGAGFMAAKAAKDNEVPFKLFIPHPQYFETYKPVSSSVWDAMVEKAQDYEFAMSANQAFSRTHNYKANRRLVETSDYLVCISAVNPDTLRKATSGAQASILREQVYPKLGKGGKILWIDTVNNEAQWVTFS